MSEYAVVEGQGSAWIEIDPIAIDQRRDSAAARGIDIVMSAAAPQINHGISSGYKHEEYEALEISGERDEGYREAMMHGGGVGGEFEFDSSWPLEEPSFWPGLQDGATASMRRDQTTAWAINQLSNSNSFKSWMTAKAQRSSRVSLAIKSLIMSLIFVGAITSGMIIFLSPSYLPNSQPPTLITSHGGRGVDGVAFEAGRIWDTISNQTPSEIYQASNYQNSSTTSANSPSDDMQSTSSFSIPYDLDPFISDLVLRQKLADLTHGQCLAELNVFASLLHAPSLDQGMIQGRGGSQADDLVRTLHVSMYAAGFISVMILLALSSLYLVLLRRGISLETPKRIATAVNPSPALSQPSAEAVNLQACRDKEALYALVDCFNELKAMHFHHRSMFDQVTAIQELLMPDMELMNQLKKEEEGSNERQRMVLEAVSVQREESRRLMEELTAGGNETITRLVEIIEGVSNA